MDKKQYFENLINNIISKNLIDIEEHLARAKNISNADGLTIEQKAVRILEEIQKMKFDTDILREMQNLHE